MVLEKLEDNLNIGPSSAKGDMSHESLVVKHSTPEPIDLASLGAMGGSPIPYYNMNDYVTSKGLSMECTHPNQATHTQPTIYLGVKPIEKSEGNKKRTPK